MALEPPPLSIYHKRRNPRRTILIVIALVIVLPLLLITGNHFSARNAVKAQMEELRAMGLAVTGEELNQLYHGHGFPPEENAAPVYEQAFAKMVERSTVEEVVREVSLAASIRQIEEEIIEALRKAVEPNNEAINLLLTAANMSYVRFDLDFTEGPALLMPHVGRIRDGARLVSGAAILAVIDGQYDSAQQLALAGYRLARHAPMDLTLIGHLTGIAVSGIARDLVEKVID